MKKNLQSTPSPIGPGICTLNDGAEPDVDGGRDARPTTAGRLRASRQSHRRGFTIIELLVSIGIIGVLFAISLPALLGARVRASELRSVANARSIASDMHAYADVKGTYPFVKIVPGGTATVRAPSTFTAMQILSNVWMLIKAWPGLVMEVAPLEEHYATWVSPGRDTSVPGLNEPSGLTSYNYSTSFLASPALWSGTATADPDLIRPTKPADVAFPSNKVLVWDSELAYLAKRPPLVEGLSNHPTPMAFADGHAAVHNPLDATPGIENPFQPGEGTRLLDTPNGVLGRDY